MSLSTSEPVRSLIKNIVWKNSNWPTQRQTLKIRHTSTTEAAKHRSDTDERRGLRNAGLSESLVLTCPKSTVASIFKSQTWRTYCNLQTLLLPLNPTGCISHSQALNLTEVSWCIPVLVGAALGVWMCTYIYVCMCEYSMVCLWGHTYWLWYCTYNTEINGSQNCRWKQKYLFNLVSIWC